MLMMVGFAAVSFMQACLRVSKGKVPIPQCQRQPIYFKQGRFYMGLVGGSGLRTSSLISQVGQGIVHKRMHRDVLTKFLAGQPPHR